ncbi:MAG: rod-binding protein [Magnetococcales bacterium]|nr:rod-binding protein [Magnetococcales bacterium]
MNGIAHPGMTPATPTPSETKSTLSPQDALRLREAAADFESMFVKQMLSSMRKAIPKQDGGLIKESQGEKIFRDLLDAEYAKTTSRSGQGLGLGASMYKQLIARYGLATSGEQGQAVPTVDEARQSVNQLQRENSAYRAAGQGQVGGVGRSN